MKIRKKRRKQLRAEQNLRPCIRQWVCEFFVGCFVHGRATQDCILCTLFIFVYFNLSLYVQCRKWFFKGVRANSISWHNVTYLFPLISHFVSDLWREQSSVRYVVDLYSFRSDILALGQISFRIHSKFQVQHTLWRWGGNF